MVDPRMFVVLEYIEMSAPIIVTPQPRSTRILNNLLLGTRSYALLGQLHKSLDRVTLKKMKYVFFLRLHMGSISYGDTLCQVLDFYSYANTLPKQLECFGSKQ